MQRRAAISVDLDSLKHYCRIFSLDEATLDERAQRLISDVAIPRYLELFDSVKVPATFFVIGEDLEAGDDAGARLATSLKRAHAQGVELASHSFSHDYALSRRPASDIAVDLARAEVTLQRATGVTPKGFRAPGYTLSPALMQVLEERRYEYDSSTYPAAPYYALKAAVMGALAVVGRPSKAVLDSPKVLLAPTQPYHPDVRAPYRRGPGQLWELPIAVSPIARVPFIGAFATSMPWPLVEATFRRLRHTRLFNFELHAIDVMDASDGIPPAIAARQRDVAVRASTKLHRLRTLFSWLAEDRQCVTLLDATRAMNSEG